MACQMEHGLELEQCGIKVLELGPWEISDEKWQFSYIAAPTDQCDRCAAWQALGKPPTCVLHCQAQCLAYGELGELQLKLAEKPKQTLFAL
jgi:anaerobic dimethyl sulfoxide reductase subunit B (iron-sulfur subunit)